MPYFQHHPFCLLFFWEEPPWLSSAAKVLEQYIRIKASVNKVTMHSTSILTSAMGMQADAGEIGRVSIYLSPSISETKLILHWSMND